MSKFSINFSITDVLQGPQQECNKSLGLHSKPVFSDSIFSTMVFPLVIWYNLFFLIFFTFSPHLTHLYVNIDILPFFIDNLLLGFPLLIFPFHSEFQNANILQVFIVILYHIFPAFQKKYYGNIVFSMVKISHIFIIPQLLCYTVS